MAALTRSFPFDTGAGGNVTEAQWREMAKHWVSDGLISTVGSGMVVTATTGMVLQVAAGAAFIQGHYGALDVATNVTVSAADPTLPRIDRVVLRLDALANAITAEVVAGTPHASPTAPALTQTSATWEISLATVAVAAATATIVSGNITDARTLTTPKNGLSGFLSAGTRVTVTGAGTPQSPYVITADAQAPTAGAGISVSGVTVTAKNRQQLANPVRNASMQVAQRGTSIATGAAIVTTLDGWWGYRAGVVAGQTVSQQTTLTDTQGSGYCARVQRDNANSSTAKLNFVQSIPTVDSRRFAGRQITFSFRARKGALYSAAADALEMVLYTGTGTDQSFVSSYTGGVSLISTSVTLTTAWQTFTATATVAANVTEMTVIFAETPVGTAGATDYFEIKDVRLDEGSYAQEHVPLPYSLDLLDAQRYFWRCGGRIAYQDLAPALCQSATLIYSLVRYPVEMRAAPTAAFPTASLLGAYDGTSLSAGTSVAVSGANVSAQEAQVNLTVASGLTQYRPYWLISNNSTSGYIDFSAEI